MRKFSPWRKEIDLEKFGRGVFYCKRVGDTVPLSRCLECKFLKRGIEGFGIRCSLEEDEEEG